jgi:hypothetical protein
LLTWQKAKMRENFWSFLNNIFPAASTLGLLPGDLDDLFPCVSGYYRSSFLGGAAAWLVVLIQLE